MRSLEKTDNPELTDFQFCLLLADSDPIKPNTAEAIAALKAFSIDSAIKLQDGEVFDGNFLKAPLC